MISFYVYEHIRNDTGEVFYVGKGSGDRIWIESNRNPYWKNIAKKCGKVIKRKLIKNIDEEFAFLIECERIDQLLRLGYNLANLTSGGEGASNPSQETRKKMSESHSGEKNSRFSLNSRRQKLLRKEFVPKDVMRANMRKNHWSKTGKYIPVKHNLSDETKLKMSLIKKNLPDIECQHCRHKAKPVTINRWHNKNCKLKGQTNG
jgi:hypothetical protein